MQEVIETIGYIFFPDNPEAKIEGVRLTISDEKILLEIAKYLPSNQNYDIILGVFNRLDKVTFIRNYTGGGVSGAGGNLFRIHSAFILKGFHFNQIEDIIAHKVNVHIPTLFDWSKIRVINNNLILDKIIEIKKVDDIQSEIGNEIKISFCFDYLMNSSFDELNLKEFTYLKIESKNDELTLDKIIEIINHFKKLILFITNRNPEAESIILYNNKISNKETTSKPWEIPIEMYFKKSNIDTSKYTITPTLNFHDVKDQIAIIIKEWFNNEMLKLSVDLLNEKAINANLSMENIFLNSCFSIETYHRTFINNKVLEKPEFRNKIKEITKNLTDVQLINWTKEKLSFANEPSLKDRLNYFKHDFSTFKSDEEKDKYLNKIIKTRNYLVHHSSKKDIFNLVEMYYAAIIIESILKITIFRKLGVPEFANQKALISAKEGLDAIIRLNEK